MGDGGVARWPGMAAAWAMVVMLAGWAGAAQAALSDSLCNPTSATLAAYPSAEALQAAAVSTETALAGRDPSSQFQDLMPALDPPTSTPQRPSRGSMAQYCAATGELMRVSPQGSQLQAQSYLLNAFQMARAEGLQGTSSVAAYRLGLVSLSGPTATGVRGAKATRGGTRAAVRGAEEAGGDQVGGACGLLLSRGVLMNTNLALSLASLGCSAEGAGAAGDNRTAALATLRLARLKLSVAEANSDVAVEFRGQARQAASAGLAYARGIDDPALRAELLGRLASAALDARAGAGPELAQAVAEIRAAQPDSPSAQSFAYALEARMALASGDAPAARRLMEQALLMESQRSLPARMPEWRLLMADMDRANHDEHVLAAYEALEAIRPLLPRFDPLTEETAFSLYMRGVFQSAVDVQLASAKGDLEVIRVKGAQQIVEAYRQAELQSVFGSECIPPREPLRPENLAAGEVLLYPILLRDRLELLYVAGGEGGATTFKRLPPNRGADRQTVSRLVETMVLSLSADEDDNWRPASRQLYDLLIKPIEGELKPGSVLAVVPDGPLRGLPFSALLDADNRYLIQRTRVSVAPALAYSQPGAYAQTLKLQVVAASLEMEVRLPAGDFEKLNGTAAEAKLAAVVDGNRVARALEIPNFKKLNLTQALSNQHVDILHLATHASFNGRSDRAFIVANGEAILLSELRQMLAQNRARGDELDLLVLSACETAVGDDEASMGLAGAAVQAGARSAIASLWPVNDVGTGELMKAFYEGYRQGLSKSAALREAQLSMLAQGGVRANPNIWAAFTLLGAWR